MSAKRTLCAIALALVCACGRPHAPKLSQREQVEYSDFILLKPAGLVQGKKYPLLVALSPGGDAPSLIAQWEPLAKDHHWIVLASRTHRNGVDVEPIFAAHARDIKTLIQTEPIDPARIIANGVSGGGTGSHLLAFFYPDIFAAVIVNSGVIHPDFTTRRDKYPKGKLAVFLCSPTDPNYEPMKRDRDFLQGLGWDTTWIDFEGGHAPAPLPAYEKAVSWLEKKFASRN